MDKSLCIKFNKGLIQLSGNLSPEDFDEIDYDKRLKSWTATADQYRDVMISAVTKQYHVDDKARSYEKTPFTLQKKITPRPHQKKH